MDKYCVLNWLNKVYVTPNRAFNEYTDDELKMFAHDALVLLKQQEPAWVLFQRECETLPNHYEKKGFCPKCNQVVEWYLNRSYCGFCGRAVKWDA